EKGPAADALATVSTKATDFQHGRVPGGCGSLRSHGIGVAPPGTISRSENNGLPVPKYGRLRGGHEPWAGTCSLPLGKSDASKYLTNVRKSPSTRFCCARCPKPN